MEAKNRASVRLSTYSKSPSDTQTEASMSSFGTNGDPRYNDLRSYSHGLDRMESRKLADQRYVISPEKEGDMGKIALGAKVQRALDRRYSNQDAIYKPKKKTEKTAA